MTPPEPLQGAFERLRQLWVQPAHEVIDEELWKRLSQGVQLPETARSELTEFVRQERGDFVWRSMTKRKPPNESRKELEQLYRYARKLEEGLNHLSADAGVSLWQAFTSHSPALQTRFPDRYAATMAEIAWIRERLFGAAAISRKKNATKGGDTTLRDLLRAIDKFLTHHTTHGLARASYSNNTSRSWATACTTFSANVVRLITGKRPAEATLDDAMKDVIRRRRTPVG